MKGKNWREYAPPEKQRRPVYRQPERMEPKRKRRRRGGVLRKLLLAVILFGLGYGGFLAYQHFAYPYTVALDAGHGGADGGAQGLISEDWLTEETADALEALLKADGRFRVVRSRENGETKSITDRNKKFVRAHPDVVLSIHANADEDGSGYGFECYPAVPGMENHEESLSFAGILAEKMEEAGARLRGDNGIRYGYYVPQEDGSTQKMLVESSDETVYEYDTFGILKNVDCAAVLVEQCFVTNAGDVSLFGTEDGCRKAAEAYYAAILEYLGAEPVTE